MDEEEPACNGLLSGVKRGCFGGCLQEVRARETISAGVKAWEGCSPPDCQYSALVVVAGLSPHQKAGKQARRTLLRSEREPESPFPKVGPAGRERQCMYSDSNTRTIEVHTHSEIMIMTTTTVITRIL